MTEDSRSTAENPLFRPIDHKSVLLPFLQGVLWIASWLNLYWIAIRLSKRASGSRVFLEFYLLTWMAIGIAPLLLTRLKLFNVDGTTFAIFGFLAVYRLLAIFHSRAIYFTSGNIDVTHGRASLLIALLNLYEVTQAFAVLFLWYGGGWEPAIESSITAFYQSMLTFTTLGYGDIKPITETTQLLVVAQLTYFLFFFVMVLPIVLSLGSREYTMTQDERPNSLTNRSTQAADRGVS